MNIQILFLKRDWNQLPEIDKEITHQNFAFLNNFLSSVKKQTHNSCSNLLPNDKRKGWMMSRVLIFRGCSGSRVKHAIEFRASNRVLYVSLLHFSRACGISMSMPNAKML